MNKYRPKPPDEIARNMSAIRSTGNQAEVSLRKRLHKLGLRYRLQAGGLPGRPDIIFPRARVVVFVDGDFWHARVLRERGPEALESGLRTKNRDYWITKFSKRVARDDAVTMKLSQSGWMVIRCWESDVFKDLNAIAKQIASLVQARKT